MKTKATHKAIVLITLLCMSIICCKCKDDNPEGCGTPIDDYYNLTDAQKAKVPYLGKDTLLFISNNGDTARCIGIGTKSYYLSYPKNGNPACPNGFQRYETVEYAFNDAIQNKLNNITIDIYKQDPDSHFYDAMVLKCGSVTFSTLLLYLNDSYYKDTITVDNQKYNALKFYTGSNYLFYNHTDGILRIQFNSVIWNLKK